MLIFTPAPAESNGASILFPGRKILLLIKPNNVGMVANELFRSHKWLMVLYDPEPVIADEIATAQGSCWLLPALISWEGKTIEQLNPHPRNFIFLTIGLVIISTI